MFMEGYNSTVIAKRLGLTRQAVSLYCVNLKLRPHHHQHKGPLAPMIQAYLRGEPTELCKGRILKLGLPLIQLHRGWRKSKTETFSSTRLGPFVWKNPLRQTQVILECHKRGMTQAEISLLTRLQPRYVMAVVGEPLPKGYPHTLRLDLVEGKEDVIVQLFESGMNRLQIALALKVNKYTIRRVLESHGFVFDRAWREAERRKIRELLEKNMSITDVCLQVGCCTTVAHRVYREINREPLA